MSTIVVTERVHGSDFSSIKYTIDGKLHGFFSEHPDKSVRKQDIKDHMVDIENEHKDQSK